MSKMYNVNVSEETSNAIHKIDLEVSSKEKLLNSFADKLGIKSKVFKDYEKEYIELNSQYEKIKEHLLSIYVPNILMSHQYNWGLNFKTNTLEIEIICDCGIELLDSGKLDNIIVYDNLIESFNLNKLDII